MRISFRVPATALVRRARRALGSALAELRDELSKLRCVESAVWTGYPNEHLARFVEVEQRELRSEREAT